MKYKIIVLSLFKDVVYLYILEDWTEDTRAINVIVRDN